MKLISLFGLAFLLSSCTPFEQELMLAQVELTTVVENINKLQTKQFVRGDEPADLLVDSRKKLEHIFQVLKKAPAVAKIKPQYQSVYVEVEKMSVEFLHLNQEITVLIPEWRMTEIQKELPLLDKALVQFASVMEKRIGHLFGTGSKRIWPKADTQLFDTAPICQTWFKKFGPWTWTDSSTSCTTDSDGNMSCWTTDTTESCEPPSRECGHQLDLNCFENEMKVIDVTSRNFSEYQCQKPFRAILAKCKSPKAIFK